MKPQTTNAAVEIHAVHDFLHDFTPTFSKSMSMPLGVAAASFSFQSACL